MSTTRAGVALAFSAVFVSTSHAALLGRAPLIRRRASLKTRSLFAIVSGKVGDDAHKAGHPVATALLLIASIVGSGETVLAAPVTYQYQGVVTSRQFYNELLPASIVPGVTFSYSFTFDESGPDEGLPSWPNYQVTPTQITFAWLDHVISYAPNHDSYVSWENNVNNCNWSGANISPVSDNFAVRGGIRATDDTIVSSFMRFGSICAASEFTPWAMSGPVTEPLGAPPIPSELWPITEFYLAASKPSYMGGQSETITGSITFGPTVPIPASVYLFGGALGVLGVLKRRQATASHIEGG